MLDRIKDGGAARVGVISGLFTSLFVAGVMLAGPSSAAGDPVEAAFTSMEGKVTTYGAALAAITVLAVGILLGLAWLKKARSA
jgi:hypothetical protein